MAAGYLAVVFGLGMWARRRSRADGQDYFLAGRSVGAWPLGLSVMVTLFSAVNFTAFPTEIIGHGLYVWASVPVFLLAAWPVSRWFIPWFRAQSGDSGYAWLEARYNASVRRTAAVLFLFWRVAWMATALYATGQVAGPMIGWPPVGVMAAATGLALAYTSMGGLRAVIWTDLLQFGVLCGSLILAVLWTGIRLPDGVSGLLARGLEAGAFRPFHPTDMAFWRWDPTLRITFWSGMIGTWVAFMARYCADQMVLQRYRSARTVQAAQRGIWLNAWAALLVLSLLTLLGLAAAAGVGPDAGPAPARLAALFRSMPGPVAGLVAAALLAATMSSMDSGLHACSLTLWADFHAPGSDPLNRARRPRGSLPLLAVAVFLLALPLGRLGGLFALVNRVINGLGAPLFSLILAAIYGRGMTARGLAWGGGLGFAVSVAISLGMQDLALHYYAVLNGLATLLLCRGCSGVDAAIRTRTEEASG